MDKGFAKLGCHCIAEINTYGIKFCQSGKGRHIYINLFINFQWMRACSLAIANIIWVGLAIGSLLQASQYNIYASTLQAMCFLLMRTTGLVEIVNITGLSLCRRGCRMMLYIARRARGVCSREL